MCQNICVLNRKMFTLTETLIAFVIITIVALSVYSAMIFAKKSAHSLRIRDRAMTLVSQRLEEIAKCSYRDVKDFGESYPSGKDETSVTQVLGIVGGIGEDEYDYTPLLPNISLNSYVIDYGTSCKIVVTVRWSGEDGEVFTARNHVFKYDDR